MAETCSQRRERTSTSCSELFTSSDEDYDYRSDGAGIDDFFSRIHISSASHEILACTSPKVGPASLIDLEGEAARQEADGLTEERRWMKNFAEPDGPENIIYEEHEILAATKEKLISSLSTKTDGEESIDEFLMTFRLFMEPTELARMIGFRLRMAYMQDSPENQRLRLMTFRFVKRWLTLWIAGYPIQQVEAIRTTLNEALNRIWEDAVLLTLTDKQLLLNMGQLVGGEERAESTVESAAITRSSSKSGRSWLRRLFTEAPTGNSAESFDPFPSDYEVLLMEKSEKIADQLCLVERQVFAEVEWRNLLDILRSKSSKPSEQTTLERAVAHFNAMCHWFVEQLTRPRQSVSMQTTKLKKIIKIGHKSLNRANYTTAMQAALALQNHKVTAMKEAWERLPKTTKEQYEGLAEITSPLKNFRTLRMAIEAAVGAGKPCCPFLGLYIADLRALAEAPVDYQSTLIPWYKYKRAAELVMQTRELQRLTGDYQMTKDPALYSFLLECAKLRKTATTVFI